MACGTSIFGTNNQYIKIVGGDFVAVENSNTVERIFTSDLRIPYQQVMKSKIYLKEGQVNYLLNSLGLGYNATFLIIKAVYNTNSVNEEDNYISWSYYNDLTRVNYFDQLMVLTGNSTHRIPQIYLTNPSTKYPVILEVMVSSIDESYSVYYDNVNQTGTTFVNLSYTDIKTHVAGESIVVNDKNTNPLIYISLSDINAIDRNGSILTINDSSRDLIFLHFSTQYDADQAYSLINYVMENTSVNINTLSPVYDSIAPVIYFYSNVGNSSTHSTIDFNGSTSVPYDTGYGITFSTSISLSEMNNYIGKGDLINLLISGVSDNRDGTMSIFDTNIYIGDGMTASISSTMSSITSTGTYSMVFNMSDIANNYINAIVTLDIID